MCLSQQNMFQLTTENFKIQDATCRYRSIYKRLSDGHLKRNIGFNKLQMAATKDEALFSLIKSHYLSLNFVIIFGLYRSAVLICHGPIRQKH